MANLTASRKLWIWTSIVTVLSGPLAGCAADNTTAVIPLETDTTISSDTATNRSEETELTVENNVGGPESRVLLKLPTGQQDPEDNLAKALEDVFYFVFFMPWAILTRMANCKAEQLTAANVNTAFLDFSVASGAVIAGDLKISLLSMPWWQTATWNRAHPFSNAGGLWTSPGGDVYSAAQFTPINNTMNAADVRFDIKAYFQSLIQDEAANDNNRKPHYGFLLQSTAATFAQLKLKSVQTLTSTEGPRVVVNYNTSACTLGNYIDFHSGRSADYVSVTALGPRGGHYLARANGSSSQPVTAVVPGERGW